MNKKIFKSDFKFWRYLINFWSIIFFIVIILDFYFRNYFDYSNFLEVVAVIYVSVLAIYVSDKEFERWYDKHNSQHPGEIFVIIWSVLIFTLFILSFIFAGEYQIPGSVISSYIAVLTILAVTKKSKEMYKIKRPLKIKENKK